MPPTFPTLVAVGPWDRAEFAALRDELDGSGQWPTIDSLEKLAANLESTSRLADEAAPSRTLALPTELVLVAVPKPDPSLQPQLDRLVVVAPLTRVVVVAGSWCEGELRTGSPPVGVIRLYWYEFAPWWRESLAGWRAGVAPAWSGPLGDASAARPASSPDRAHDNEAPTPREVEQLLAVDAIDFETFETLAAALGPHGWNCRWQPRHRPELIESAGYAAAVWDGGQLSTRELDSLASLVARMRERHPSAPVIALLDFPRVEHVTAARDVGAASILGKPYQVAHLAWELQRLLAAAAGSTAGG
jgi:hypothetical protein